MNDRQTQVRCAKANSQGRAKLVGIVKTGLLLLVGASMSACAATRWKEEVLLHDGSKIIVERTQIREGRHHIGQGPPIKEQTLTFTPPGSKKSITWKNEYGSDIGRATLKLLAVHILNGTSYVVASPSNCIIYDKLGRPNPPYIFLVYAGRDWERIPLNLFPPDFKLPNLVLDTYGHRDVEQAIEIGFISATNVTKLNSNLTQSEYKTILRAPVDRQGACPLPTGPDGRPVQLNSPRGK